MSLKKILLRSLNQRKKYINIATASVRCKHELDRYSEVQQQHSRYRKLLGTVLFGAVVLANVSKDDKDEDVDEAGQRIPGLPVYRADEVNKHSTEESFWVIYKNGVYDVTSFLPSHPGGAQILNAGGLSIEPFWNVYGVHKSKEIYKLLETYRIGNLHEDDVCDNTDDEIWAREPRRSNDLIMMTPKPFNAETPPKVQIKNFDTPNDLFFIRNHMAVPDLKAEEHVLKIEIINDKENVSKEIDLCTLLNKYPFVVTRATIMCAGNRRSEMTKNVPKTVRGISWSVGATSTARWAGVYLRDVLIDCGVNPDDTDGKHVIFTGSDMDATGNYFNTSIPLHQALHGKVLLAVLMNGDVLPRDHGYPLRVIVPGAPAVRCVKWLRSITVSKEESSSHWHKEDYRSFNSSTDWETADFSSAPPIYSMPVTSAICEPADGDTCKVVDGHIEISGYAYSGGGAKIVRVDVSPDCGASWLRAGQLLADPAPPSHNYSWTIWRAKVPVPPGQTEMEIWAKATDSNFNTQPEKFDDIWNIRGLLSNAYQRIRVKIEPELICPSD